MKIIPIHCASVGARLEPSLNLFQEDEAISHPFRKIELMVTKLFNNSQHPGKEHVRNMIHLAQQGSGLSTYVNQHVRENYALKLPLH